MKGKISYSLDKNEINEIRSSLLHWYAENQRDLPWRRASTSPGNQQHAYAVWVSEIMLQQTRVATVVDYYNRWMSKWPTVADLARATLDQVNEAWAGLGYYSRARRLHEGAVKVVDELDGKIPATAAGLAKLIPGVGRYTAGAISSIAFGEAAGVLDGNVIRVLCRLLTIGGDCSSKNVLSHLWNEVDCLVSQENPGDFNQAIMELGALVCTPKSPDCSNCPLKRLCGAYKQMEDYKYDNSVLKMGKKRRKKVEENSSRSSKKSRKDRDCDVNVESCADFLSFPSDHPWIPDLGVTNYPRKADKKPPRQETAFVSVVEMKVCPGNSQSSNYLMTQRPKTGLLAGLWEFPTLLLTDDEVSRREFQKMGGDKKLRLSNSTGKVISKAMAPVLRHYLTGVNVERRTTVGEYTHVFSHIHRRYIIEHIFVTPGSAHKREYVGEEKKLDGISPSKWVAADDLTSCAMSSAMHKILRICHGAKDKTLAKTKVEKVDKNQPKLDSFFVPKTKKVHLNSIKTEA